jgi:hypothetical protein
MAQFSHADFGGMSQWSPGMSMVGDMFNTQLKAKLDALCSDIAAYLEPFPTAGGNAICRGRGQLPISVGNGRLVAGRNGPTGRRRGAE